MAEIQACTHHTGSLPEERWWSSISMVTEKKYQNLGVGNKDNE